MLSLFDEFDELLGVVSLHLLCSHGAQKTVLSYFSSGPPFLGLTSWPKILAVSP